MLRAARTCVFLAAIRHGLAAPQDVSPSVLSEDDACRAAGGGACALSELQTRVGHARGASDEAAARHQRFQREQQELLQRQLAEIKAEQQAAEAHAANGTGGRLSAEFPSCLGCKCFRQGCCPRNPNDCITDACQVAEIYYYLVEQGKGSACTDYVRDTLPSFAGGGKTVEAGDICVSSSLVSSIQGFVATDPGNCVDKIYGPTALAPQLGCSQWAWFSSADAILNFVRTAYSQETFDPTTLVDKLVGAAGAGINPGYTDSIPVKWAKVTIFDRTQPYAPRLLHPGGPALVEGPRTKHLWTPPADNFVYGSDRTAPPSAPPANETGGQSDWWRGANFQDTACPVWSDLTCKRSQVVLNNLNLLATQELLALDYAQITGCPWTQGARPANGQDQPQPGDVFNLITSEGVYSCTGTFAQQASCMVCPADSGCLLPTADHLSANGGFQGCGARAQECYPVGWFGITASGASFPTAGCKPEWVEDMRQWLANPAEHLKQLSERPSGQITSIQAINTLMFTRDDLFTGGHSGWDYFAGGVHLDDNGEPTCSTNGAPSFTDGPWSPGTGCGTSGNLPCCNPRQTDENAIDYVSLASNGGPNVEWVTENCFPNPCLTTLRICGPPGFGPKMGPYPWSPTLTCT